MDPGCGLACRAFAERDEAARSEEEEPSDAIRKLMALQRIVGQGNGESGPSHADAAHTTGCTAVVALLKGTDLYVANAGDSRAVLCRGTSAIPLSEDHKPADARERERIIAAGGFLSDVGGMCRVNGNLNLSRAIGDLCYKTNSCMSRCAQIITAEPDVSHVSLKSGEDRFLVLACDGIYDVLNSDQVVTFVRERLDAGKAPMTIASELLDACLAEDPREARGIGCDNQTAVIVVFQDQDQGKQDNVQR